MAESQTPSQVSGSRESLLFWFLGLLGRARRPLLICGFLAAVVSLVISLYLPNWYASTATVLPPRDSGFLGSLGTISAAIRDISPLRGLGGLSGRRESYNYLSILDSRSAKEAVVRKFNLLAVYEITDSSMEKAIKELESNVDVIVADEGHVSVSVLDTDPVRAAEMANYYVEVLNKLSRTLSSQEAKESRVFIEKRYVMVLEDLKRAEDSLKAFQRRYGIYSLTEALSGKGLSTFVPFERVPELTMQYFRLQRDLEIQSKLLEFALPLYEQAKVDEQRESSVALVLDWAVPAEKKAKPKRSLIVILSTLSVGLLTLTFYAIWERVGELKRESPNRYAILRSVFRLRGK